jgi:imidazolonepropionase-like amidohydrolase
VTGPLHLRGVFLPDEVERDLWIIDGRLTFEAQPGAETVADRGFVLPGLVDAHCHPGLDPNGAVQSIADAKALALIDRDAGVLTIRDAGSPLDYRELDDDPEMPRLIRAGQHLAPPKRYLPGIGTESGSAELADHAATQARAGNGWIKLVGDWIDRTTGDLTPTYDDATFAAAVAAAHAAGARVAVHTFSEAALPGLIAAGVDSVEHGTGLSLNLIDELARRRTALVPTMTNIENFAGIAAKAEAKYPQYADHMRRMQTRFPDVVRAAYEAGVPIYVGTDAGGSIRHGLAAEEMLLLQQAGLPATGILASASWGARGWLGFPGLVEGGLADLVVYPADPRADLAVVRHPQRIVLRGRVVR